jgi:SAM-dependent methyltransferase
MNHTIRALDRQSVYRMLRSWVPDGTPPDEMEGYIREAAGRILETARLLEQLPHGAKVLEIGSIPYYLPLLLRTVRLDLDWTGTNWHDETKQERHKATSRNVETGEVAEFKTVLYNVEMTAQPPFEEGSFDVAVYCEVFEHLYEDPVQSLENLHRAVRPGGHLLLTTPNPARATNLQRLALQHSVHDPFSGYGIYGRHNREYSRKELIDLLENVGFETLSARTIESSNSWVYRRVLARAGYGEYHILWARRREGEAKRYRPRWLYRSFDEAFHAASFGNTV